MMIKYILAALCSLVIIGLPVFAMIYGKKNHIGLDEAYYPCNPATGRTVWKEDHEKGEPFSYNAAEGGVILVRSVKKGDPVMAADFKSFGTQPVLKSGMPTPPWLLPYLMYQCEWR